MTDTAASCARESDHDHSEDRPTRHGSGALHRYGTAECAARYLDKYTRSRSRRRTARRENEILATFLARLAPEASLLNTACGPGRFTDVLRPQDRTLAAYTDASEAMLARARHTLEEAGADRVLLGRADVTVHEPSGSFDIVTCIRLLHHFRHDEQLVRALDYLCSSSDDALVVTIASTSTFRGWSRALRGRLFGRRRGERVLTLRRLHAELALRGFALDTVRYVDRLFSSQTWVLARRR